MENKQNFDEMVTRSQKIRALYHKLELLCRTQQGRWPKGKDTIPELEHKPGECMWWLPTF